MTNLADYMLNVIYRQDQDAPVLIGSSTQPRNFYAIRPRTADGKFFFETWDGEISLDNVNYDRTEISGNFNPARLYQQFGTNAEFRQLVADRVYKFFFNGGALTPQATAARYQNLVNQINVSIVGESARWGDAQAPSQPAMRDTDWLTEINGLFNNYFPQRAASSSISSRRISPFSIPCRPSRKSTMSSGMAAPSPPAQSQPFRSQRAGWNHLLHHRRLRPAPGRRCDFAQCHPLRWRIPDKPEPDRQHAHQERHDLVPH